MSNLTNQILAFAPEIYYNLDEPSGTVCNDSSTNARNGATTGVVTRGAAALAGSGASTTLSGSGYVSAANAAWNDFHLLPFDFTWHLLANLGAGFSDAGSPALISKGQTSSGNDAAPIFRFETSHKLSLLRGFTANLGPPTNAPVITYDNNWHQFAFSVTHDGLGGGTYQIVMDGVAYGDPGTFTGPWNNLSTNTEPLIFGAQSNGGAISAFLGAVSIDECFFTKQALTVAQLANIWSAAQTNYSNASAFDLDSGTVIAAGYVLSHRTLVTLGQTEVISTYSKLISPPNRSPFLFEASASAPTTVLADAAALVALNKKRKHRWAGTPGAPDGAVARSLLEGTLPVIDIS